MTSNVGFIGCGNITESIVRGFYNTNTRSTLYCYDQSMEKVNKLKQKYNINECNNVQELLLKSDFVVLAVKPQDLRKLITNISTYVEKQIIVSVAAGVNINIIKQMFQKDIKIIRIMPNTSASVNKAVIGVEYSNIVTSVDKEVFNTIFAKLGVIVQITEQQFAAFTALCGSGPAFVYKFIDGMIKAVENVGLEENVFDMVIQVIEGACQVAKTSKSTLLQLQQNVASKGGVTIEGLRTLSKYHFDDILKETIKNTTDRSVELTKELKH